MLPSFSHVKIKLKLIVRGIEFSVLRQNDKLIKNLLCEEYYVNACSLPGLRTVLTTGGS